MEQEAVRVLRPVANRFDPRGLGIVPSLFRHASLVQSVEQQALNLRVRGSSP